MKRRFHPYIIHASTTNATKIKKLTKRKLVGWKTKYLSIGGKLTELKSTLSNLPTLFFYLLLFTIPTHVANKIEKIQMDFFIFFISNKII